jgi:hypothetical protein
MAVVAVERNQDVRRGRRGLAPPEDGALLVSRVAVMTSRKTAMIAFRNAMLGLPTRAKQRLGDELVPADVAMLDNIVRDVLSEFADRGARRKPGNP